MDRILFRKRTTSSAQKDPQPYPHNILKKSPSHQSFGHHPYPSGSRRTPDKSSGSRSGIPDKPPSLDVDIRNSLILPGLSQRFSVLLPSLSTAPEVTIRDLLASQRTRDGPSLTSEEEELLFQEIHESVQSQYGDGGYRGHIPNSLSLPDRLNHPPDSAPLPTSRSDNWQQSPPPTSNSFASFQTFGNPSATSPKSYGGLSFSSGSTLRDGEVMRKKARNHANNLSSPDSTPPKLPEISVDKANDYYHDRKASTSSGSEESATPTTAAMNLPKVHSAASSSTQLADLPPQLPAPTSLLPPTPARAKRASLLAGLTPAQVKRISSALGEIQQKLQQNEPVRAAPAEDDVEELDPTPIDIVHRQRHPSDTSTRSAASSVFPFGVSPTGSSFTANMSGTGSTTATPPKLSHSPRSHNLQAHIQPERPPPPTQPIFAKAPKAAVPQPILTPSRTMPARHTPSLSLSSTGDLSPVPVYVPGQPRPVGSTHRSDGSVSSRSGTPTHGEGLNLGHARADSTPSPRIAARATSLGRSRSVNQTYTPVKSSLHESIGSTSSRRPSDPRRLSSSLGSHSPRDDVIQEDEEEEDHRAEYHSRNDRPELRHVPRHSVAESKHSSLDQSPVPGPGSLKFSPTIPSCVPSQEGTMEESSDTHGTVETRNTSISVSALRSPTLRRSRSLDSLSSGFMEFDELGWEDIFSNSNSDSDMPVTPGDDLQAYAQTLKRLTGMGQEELVTMQDKLVDKARQERRALRDAMDESPLIPYSPPNQPRASPVLAYDRGPSPQPAVTSPLVLGPVIDRVVMPRRAAPPPPEPTSQPMDKTISATSRSEESEVVFTPATPGPTRKVSRRIAPENDPEIRRDFEARIAAATAALNRTPSNHTASLSRKFSRNKGAVNISSPRLMSSSSNVPTTPLSTPEMDVARALDKASGSSKKMSLRWKKLKKGLSFSGDGTPQSLPDGASPILEEPIALQKRDIQTKPATLTSPDINSFKFPNSAASDQPHPRPILPLPSPPASAPLARVPKPISAESPPDKFVQAGRAAGLDDEQLEEMIKVNGLGTTTAAAGPSVQRSTKPDAPQEDIAKVEPAKGPTGKAKGLLRALSKNRKVEPVATDVQEIDESVTPTAPMATRNLPADPRHVVRRTLLIPTEGHNGINVQDSPGQNSTGSPGSTLRKASVRRKPLNLSREDQQLVSQTPSPHSRNFSMNSSHKSDTEEIPEPTENAGLGFLQPPDGMSRTASNGTALTGASDVPSDRASSGGASFYDYYGEGEETLVSPKDTNGRPSRSRTASQAVEITEYADGRMVWSLVDGLRDIDAADTVLGHSRNTSYDSAKLSDTEVVKADESRGTFGPTAGLILRHKDRGQTAARPPTNVYYTSPADVADLIDHLSKDLEDSNRGRIDILPSRGASRLTEGSAPFAYANSQSDRSPNANTLSTVSGQFEDAPSPRKGPPPPISVPKTNMPGPRSPTHARNTSGQIGSASVPAAGFSPKRQLFLRHGRRGGSISAQSGKSINPSSPGAASFNTSISGMSGMSGMSASKSVEDRLQALLDRLKDNREVKGEGEEAAFNVYA